MDIQSIYNTLWAQLDACMSAEGTAYGIDYRTMIQSPLTRPFAEVMRALVEQFPHDFGPEYDKAFHIRRN
jgi:hypothetical protein